MVLPLVLFSLVHVENDLVVTKILLYYLKQITGNLRLGRGQRQRQCGHKRTLWGTRVTLIHTLHLHLVKLSILAAVLHWSFARC